MAFDPFDRAVPGESLTKPMTDDMFQPAKVDDLDTALYSTVDTIRNNKELYEDLMQMIDAGVDLESIANVITFGSASKGQYSPDIAMQLTPLLTVWMYSEAREHGVENDDIKIMNFPSNQSKGNMSEDDIMALMKRRNPEKHKRVQKESATTILDDFFKDTVSKENGTEELGSFMDMQKPETDVKEVIENG
tara:strand:+ start:91 stop:663 length:573 start_codon:yes stop_codon:yes gene_type:complete